MTGERIRLIEMPEDPDPIPKGSLGTVLEINHYGDWTQVDVQWDSGRRLSLSVPPDRYEVLEDQQEGSRRI